MKEQNKELENTCIIFDKTKINLGREADCVRFYNDNGYAGTVFCATAIDNCIGVRNGRLGYWALDNDFKVIALPMEYWAIKNPEPITLYYSKSDESNVKSKHSTIWNSLSIIFYTLMLTLSFYFVALPEIIEHRAKDLNFMRYDGAKDKFIPKDSINISGWDLHYLQHGTFKGK